MRSDQAIAFQCEPTREIIKAVVLKSPPTVISVGRICLCDGWTFHWEPGDNPDVVHPGRKRVSLEVENYVLYLRRRRAEAGTAAAATNQSARAKSTALTAHPAPCTLNGGHEASLSTPH